MAIAAQIRAQRGGVASAELVQKLASLVVDAMGGVVEDADRMSREWYARSRELCAGLNSIALPLGSLRIGLSRHRSLLFKVSLFVCKCPAFHVSNIPTVANVDIDSFLPVICCLYFVPFVQSIYLWIVYCLTLEINQ